MFLQTFPELFPFQSQSPNPNPNPKPEWVGGTTGQFVRRMGSSWAVPGQFLNGQFLQTGFPSFDPVALKQLSGSKRLQSPKPD